MLDSNFPINIIIIIIIIVIIIVIIINMLVDILVKAVFFTCFIIVDSILITELSCWIMKNKFISLFGMQKVAHVCSILQVLWLRLRFLILRALAVAVSLIPKPQQNMQNMNNGEASPAYPLAEVIDELKETLQEVDLHPVTRAKVWTKLQLENQ